MADFPLGSLLSGGASLIGNLGAQRLQKKSMTHGIRMRVADARAAGIHPLAALGASLATPNFSSVTGDAVGDALKNIGNEVAGVGREGAELANERTRAEIERIRAETRALTDAQSRTIIGNARRIGQTTDGSGTGHTSGRNRPGRLWTPFGHLEVDPRTTPAQDWQDELGDAMENIAGMGFNLPANLLRTIRRHVRRRRIYQGIYGAAGESGRRLVDPFGPGALPGGR